MELSCWGHDWSLGRPLLSHLFFSLILTEDKFTDFIEQRREGRRGEGGGGRERDIDWFSPIHTLTGD